MKRTLLVAAPLALALAFSPLATIAAAPSAKSDKPQHISMGQPVQIADYVVKGKTTIFDFSSEYCPPCRAIAPKLAALHAKRSDIVVVTVDINRPDVKGIDWKSPVARQYDLHSIPHFKVFGPDGKLKAEGDEAYGLVNGMVE